MGEWKMWFAWTDHIHQRLPATMLLLLLKLLCARDAYSLNRTFVVENGAEEIDRERAARTPNYRPRHKKNMNRLVAILTEPLEGNMAAHPGAKASIKSKATSSMVTQSTWRYGAPRWKHGVGKFKLTRKYALEWSTPFHLPWCFPFGSTLLCLQVCLTVDFIVCNIYMEGCKHRILNQLRCFSILYRTV